MAEISGLPLSSDSTSVIDLSKEISISARRLAEIAAEAKKYDAGYIHQQVEHQFDELEKLFFKSKSLDYSPRTPSWSNKPDLVIPTITLGGIRVGSIGNITTLIGNPGSGKSAICEALMAVAVNPECDGLGLHVLSGKSIVYVDTERSWEDHHFSWQRALRRAAVEDMPEKVRWFWLADCDAFDVKVNWINRYLDEQKPGIMIIDGLADLIANVNDPEASNGLLLMLLSRAKKHGISLCCTIHGNPNSGQNGSAGEKARGHLGSELLRKSESVLMIRKEDGGLIRTLTTEFGHGKNRSGSDNLAHSFCWSEERKMFVSCDTPEKQPTKPAKEDEYQELCERLVEIKHGPWTWTRLIDEICSITGKSENSAKWKMRYLREHSMVTQRGDEWYIGDAPEQSWDKLL
jgi:hypothetical protein